jgi:hypothetical protein
MTSAELLHERRDELQTACREHGVRELSVFGSMARSDTTESSDIDFLVEFVEMDPHAHKEAYFGLLTRLQGLFARDVDLVEAPALRNPYIKGRIERERVTVYAAA